MKFYSHFIKYFFISVFNIALRWSMVSLNFIHEKCRIMNRSGVNSYARRLYNIHDWTACRLITIFLRGALNFILVNEGKDRVTWGLTCIITVHTQQLLQFMLLNSSFKCLCINWENTNIFQRINEFALMKYLIFNKSRFFDKF